MTTATIRIRTTTRELLRELAAQTGKSMQALVGEAVSAYRRRLQGGEIPAAEAKPELPRVGMDDELAEDPNALAYKRLDKAFLAQNEGEYAAFCGGALVGTAADRATLLDRIQEAYPSKACLVVKVAKQDRLVRFRRPRRMSKPTDARL